MATLTGKITDVTSKPPENISSITVKAPSVRIGSGTDVIVSSPATVDFNRDTGDITISGLTGGLSWLYIEGDGWTDSIPLAVAEGMITLVEAIANAAGTPGLVDFITLLVDLQARIDAIAQAAVDAAAADIAWHQDTPDPSWGIADFPNGAWKMQSTSHQEALGLPRAYGVLMMYTSSPDRQSVQNAKTAMYLTLSHASSTQLLIRSTNNTGVWEPEWRDISEGYKPPTKRAAVPLTFPRGSSYSDDRPTLTIRIPFKFGAAVKRARLRLRNYDYRSDHGFPGAYRIVGAGIGKHQINDDGSMTGLVPEGESVTQLMSSTSMTGPDEAAGDWVEVDLEANTDYLLSYSFTADDGMVYTRQTGQCFTNRLSSGWNRVGSVTATPSNMSVLAAILDVEVLEDTPIYGYLGDSQTAAISASRPGYDSWAMVHSRLAGAIPTIHGHAGGGLNEWQDTSKPAYGISGGMARFDRFHISMGSNDISGGRPFSGVQEYLTTVMQNWRNQTDTFVLHNYLPRTGDNPTDTVRNALNDWVLNNLPGNALYAVDVYGATVDPATGLMDERWRGSINDVHMNSAGNARVATVTAGGTSAGAELTRAIEKLGNNYPSLLEPELLSLNHTMTGTGVSSSGAWVPFSPAPPGWTTHNTVPVGEFIFMLSTDSPNSDFTLTFRSGNSSSPVVLTRTGNRNNPVTVRVRNPGVGSYSVQHGSLGSTLTMRVIGASSSPTPQAVAIDTDGTPYASTSSGTHYVLTDERGPYVAATATRSLQISADGTPIIK